jgi:hypothetical protein
MEVPQGNFLCSHLKQVKKCHFFSSFYYTKSEDRRAEKVLLGGVGAGEMREEVGKW